jgi:hemophore-related protein
MPRCTAEQDLVDRPIITGNVWCAGDDSAHGNVSYNMEDQGLMTSGKTRLIAGIGSIIGGITLAGLGAPAAFAAPDCSPAGVDSAAAAVVKQAQAYLAGHPAANKVLMTASLQPRPQAEANLQAYAASNPQEYAEFKAILTPLAVIQDQCGVPVVPPQFQWAFDQFVS